MSNEDKRPEDARPEGNPADRPNGDAAREGQPSQPPDAAAGDGGDSGSGGRPLDRARDQARTGRPDGRGGGGQPYRRTDDRQGGRPYGKPGGGRPYGQRRSGDGRDDRRPRDGAPRGEDRGGGRRPDDRRFQGGGHGRPPPGRGPGRRVEFRQQRRPSGPPGGRPYDRDRGPGPRNWDRGGPPPPGPGAPVPAEMLAQDEEIVAGRRPVEEAFAARREAKRLLVVPERRAALDQLVLHATTLRIPVVEVEGGTITRVSGFDGHQGVALVVEPRRWASLDDVLALAKTRGEPPFLLALDHLEDPQNVGTLLRSAEACGVHGVIFPTRGAAPISPAAIKTSAGAVEHLLLVPMPDLAGGLVDLHARGLRIIGADGGASMTVREADMRGPVVIVTGSEGRGLNAKVRRRVDLMARIPMRGKVASLNASVAGSVFLFEAAAQRALPEAEVAQSGPQDEGSQTDTSQPEQPLDATAEVEVSDSAEVAGSDPTEVPQTTQTEPAAEADELLPEAPPMPTDEPA